VSRYADLARRHKGQHNYLDLLGERVELASKTAQAIFDRVNSQILSATSKRAAAAKKGPPIFRIVPPPTPATGRTPSTSSETKRVATVASNGNGQQDLAALSQLPLNFEVKNPKGLREYLLLIEDEPEVADLASEMLADEGYKVIIAHDGFDALKIYQAFGKNIGLVILDFFLPVMDGDAVFDELRLLNPDINVVLSSGFAEQSKIAAMLAQGLRGFIPKPYSRQKLLDQVRSTLDAARQPAA
jgi:CheY-like chemotaxis protein